MTSAIPLQLYQLSQSQLGAGRYAGRKQTWEVINK